jgi:hypothetical protein
MSSATAPVSTPSRQWTKQPRDGTNYVYWKSDDNCIIETKPRFRSAGYLLTIPPTVSGGPDFRYVTFRTLREAMSADVTSPEMAQRQADEHQSWQQVLANTAAHHNALPRVLALDVIHSAEVFIQRDWISHGQPEGSVSPAAVEMGHLHSNLEALFQAIQTEGTLAAIRAGDVAAHWYSHLGPMLRLAYDAVGGPRDITVTDR